MDKHRTNALQYGHLGTAIYDPDTQIWDFTRRIEKGSSLSLVGRSETIVPPSKDRNEQFQLHNGSGHRARQTADLLKTCPELASGSKYVLENEIRSQAITAAVDNFDPRVSTLLALGNATFVENNRIDNRTMPIAVLAWGESASSLELVTVENKSVEEISSSIHRANVPCITSRERGWWVGNGTSVRQICFSDTVQETSTWMAVRFLRSTRIFRPLCHRVPVPARYGDEESVHNIQPNSHLDANPLVNIPISSTGGHSHADVMINPWYQRQVAIVDERGNWSVWEIQGRHQQKNKSNWRADKTSFGHLPLPDTEDKESTSSPEHYDGWASITWVGETSNLLVCDRRNAVLYSITSDPIKFFKVDLDLERNSEWVLDVKNSPSSESHVLVLTSSKIFWLNVVSHEVLQDGGDERLEVSVLLSWRHFRGLEDTTLRLSLFKVGDDISLTLYSQLNLLIQTFRFSCSSENGFRPISASDPSLLPLPLELEPQGGLDNNGHEIRISSIHFEHVNDIITSRPHDALVNMKLVKVFAQKADLSIVEALYLLPMPDYQQDDMIFQEKRPTVSLNKLKKAKGISRTDDDIGDFVVDDWDESTLNSSLGQYGKLRNAKLSISSLQRLGLEDRWTYNFDWVYSIITKETNVIDEAKGVEGTEPDFDACIHAIRLALWESVPLDMGVSPSLLDITDSTPSLNDIDLNAREFQSLLDHISSEQMDPIGEYRYFRVDTQYPFNLFENRLAGFDNLPQLDITLLYDSLVRDWLAVLPSAVPNRTRMEKEKLIRSIAAELSFSRIVVLRGLQVEPNNYEFPDPIASLSDDARISFKSEDEGSMRAKKGHSRASSQPTISQDYQLPSTQISGISDSSQLEPTSSFPSTFPSSQPSPQGATNSPASRLRLYTTVDEQPSLSKDAANILFHWQPGSDPSAYDWQKTSQALEAEEAEQTLLKRSSSNKRKKREARKRMVLQQRLEHSGLPSEPATAPSPSIPMIKMSGSQPQGGSSLGLGFPQSSQMTAVGFPSSQFELGNPSQQSRAGNKGKQKKKRAAGF